MSKLEKIVCLLCGALGLVLIFLGYHIQTTILIPPNIVFILIDTLRADRIDPATDPHPISPCLSRLAKQSLYFSRAVSPSTWTKPSMASLFTGLPPEKHLVRYSVWDENPSAPVSDVLSDTFLTLPEYLAEKGFHTFAVQTNANLAPLLGFAQGYKPENYIFQPGAKADFVTQKALEFLSTAQSPFFLYLHFMEPHVDYDPPKEYLDLYEIPPGLSEEEKSLTEPAQFLKYLFAKVEFNLKKRDTPPDFEYSDAGRQEIQRRYNAEVRYVDAEIERIVTFIQKYYPKTYVIILSDHGEEFWEHNGVGHGTTLFDEQLRVPVIIHGPGILPKQIDNPISTLGIGKTIISLLDLPIPPSFEGVSLLDAKGNEISQFVTWGPWADLNIHLQGIIDYPWKLIVDVKTEDLSLYQLEQDSGETQDVSHEFQDQAQQLFQRLKQTEKSTPIRQTVPNTVAIPPEIEESLRHHGYLQ